MTPLRLTLAGLTDVGCRRTSNEDALLTSENPRVLAVADGMGGHAAGEVASGLVISTLRELLVDGIAPSAPSDESDPGSTAPHPARLRSAIEEANSRILSAISRDPARNGMGTTVVAAVVDGDQLTIAHVGDSRGYLWRDGRLQSLTSDHSWVQEQVDMGLLSPGKARSHPYRNVVTRALGSREDVDVEIQRVDLRTGDLVLLCSDGLNSMITDEEIARVIEGAGQDVQAICTRLVDAAKGAGGDDNVTVIAAAFA
jgi:protein phosphatase